MFIDVDGERETWRLGTEKIDEYETDDERIGFLRTSFIIGFLSVQSPDILDSDYLFSEPSKRGALIRALLEVSVAIRSIVEELVSADCFETPMCGHGSTQGDFEFDGETYIYFRVD